MGEVRWVRRDDDDDDERERTLKGEWGGEERDKKSGAILSHSTDEVRRGCLLDVKSDTL